MSEAVEVDIQDAVAELFAQLLNEHGYEAFEREAMKTIAGLACPIYRTRGPDRLDAILQEVPFAVENALATQLKQFRYQVIPVDRNEPIRRGMAMMSEMPTLDELERMVGPLLGHGAGLRHVRVLWSERPGMARLPRDVFVDDLALFKKLLRNDRATAIFYQRYLSEHPEADLEKLKTDRYLAGPAVLFEEPVWF